MGPVEASRAHGEIAQILAVTAGTQILLSDHTITKTGFKHKEINFQDYLMLPEIISNGFVYPSNKESGIVIFHINTDQPTFRLWCVCLKRTKNNEVFITMFHRSSMKDARRLYRRAKKKQNLLRDHKSQLAQRLLRYASRL